MTRGPPPPVRPTPGAPRQGGLDGYSENRASGPRPRLAGLVGRLRRPRARAAGRERARGASARRRAPASRARESRRRPGPRRERAGGRRRLRLGVVGVGLWRSGPGAPLRRSRPYVHCVGRSFPGGRHTIVDGGFGSPHSADGGTNRFDTKSGHASLLKVGEDPGRATTPLRGPKTSSFRLPLKDTWALSLVECDADTLCDRHKHEHAKPLLPPRPCDSHNATGLKVQLTCKDDFVGSHRTILETKLSAHRYVTRSEYPYGTRSQKYVPDMNLVIRSSN